MNRWYSGLAVFGLIAAAHPAMAQTNLVQNGNFTGVTNGYNSTLIGQTNGAGGATTVNYWNANGGYNFLFYSGTADSTGANQGGGYTANCYYGTGCGDNLYLWGPNTGGAGKGPQNGMPATDPAGGNFLAMDGDYGTQAVTQTINGLSSGTVYALSFYYAFSQQAGYTGQTTQNLTASLGTSSKSVGNYILPSEGFSGWQYETFYFEATSSSEVLSFLAYGNVQLPPFALLGDVSMVAAPEPATWGMLAVGLFGVLGAARARRSKKIAV
jgi:hypothetical protein